MKGTRNIFDQNVNSDEDIFDIEEVINHPKYDGITGISQITLAHICNSAGPFD